MAHPNIDAIVIGGSAGALDVLGVVLPALPAPCAVAVVIVIHLPASKPSQLPAVLGARTALPVREIEDKVPVAPGVVWVAPPGYHVLVERDHTFALSVDELVHFSRPSIDVLFESAAEAYGARLAGVLLTGANADGARGLLAIENAGGLCFVQAPATAVARAMPEAALARVGGARSLPVPELAAALAGVAQVTEAR
ncbi:MAG TPA: chemotaxis protein CheB [Polyangia bacterium]|nr:chemotaxis protein CheB [Polyangia bacterium]